MRKITFFLLSILPSLSMSASFDCKKAKTSSERLICSDPELSQADSDLGAAYKAALKAFPVKGFIRTNQQGWLAVNYTACNDREYCLFQAKERTKHLKSYLNAEIYSNITAFDATEFDIEYGMFIVLTDRTEPTVEVFGFYFPSGHNNAKGYPHDGNWCNETLLLSKSNGKFIYSGSSLMDDLRLTIDANSLVVSGHYTCGNRAFIDTGVYSRVKK